MSAAVAAAGAVHAKREQLAYTAGLIIIFAVPSIFILPWLAGLLGLTPPVAGAWIGGNIDTTAAVTAAGTVAGDEVLTYATIVKLTQNALIGVVAVALSVYFTLKVDKRPATEDISARPSRGAEIWQRFPKFVLGFIVASVIVSILAAVFPEGSGATAEAIDAGLGAAKTLQVLFFTLAFVSIGLEFRVSALKEAGWKPVIVFAAGTVVNLVAGLILSYLLFGVLFAGLVH